MTRISGRSRYAPRAVSSGSSASTVPDADADRVDLRPHAVRVPVGGRRGQRGPRARRRGDAAVERSSPPSG